MNNVPGDNNIVENNNNTVVKALQNSCKSPAEEMTS